MVLPSPFLSSQESCATDSVTDPRSAFMAMLMYSLWSLLHVKTYLLKNVLLLTALLKSCKLRAVTTLIEYHFRYSTVNPACPSVAIWSNCFWIVGISIVVWEKQRKYLREPHKNSMMSHLCITTIISRVQLYEYMRTKSEWQGELEIRCS